MITVDQQRRRREAVANARHSVEMEGGRISEATEADAAAYVAGVLSPEEAVERVHQRLAAQRAS